MIDGGDDMDLQDTDHTFELDAEDDAELQAALAQTFIWGTDLNLQTCINVFKVPHLCRNVLYNAMLSACLQWLITMPPVAMDRQ
jgi:hypothetical protein